MLAEKIVHVILEELRGRSGCNVEDIIDDQEIYGEMLETMVHLIQTVLEEAIEVSAHEFLEGV